MFLAWIWPAVVFVSAGRCLGDEASRRPPGQQRLEVMPTVRLEAV